jgi:hypothetical protein
MLQEEGAAVLTVAIFAPESWHAAEASVSLQVNLMAVGTPTWTRFGVALRVGVALSLQEGVQEPPVFVPEYTFPHESVQLLPVQVFAAHAALGVHEAAQFIVPAI